MRDTKLRLRLQRSEHLHDHLRRANVGNRYAQTIHYVQTNARFKHTFALMHLMT